MNLFDFANPIAHAGDPESSHEAATLMTASGARGRHAMRVLEVVKALQGLTSAELCDRQEEVPGGPLMDLTEFRRRLTDLKDAGRIVQCEARRCTVGQKKMVTWRAV